MVKREIVNFTVGLSLWLVVMATVLLLPFGAEGKPSYRRLLKRHTESDRVYELRNFEPQIVWHATHLTPELVQAQVDHLAKELHLSDEERLLELDARTAPLEKGEVFFVSFFTVDRITSDLSRSGEGRNNVPWRVEFSPRKGDEGPWVQAASIEKVRIGGFERFLYPYLDRWSDAYVAIFPKREGISPDGRFSLRLLGLGGRSTLTFSAR